MTGFRVGWLPAAPGDGKQLSEPQHRPAGPYPQHQLAALDPGHGRPVRCHRAGIDPGGEIHPDPEGLAGAIDIVQTEFDIEVRPYSLITVVIRALSPPARCCTTSF